MVTYEQRLAKWLIRYYMRDNETNLVPSEAEHFIWYVPDGGYEWRRLVAVSSWGKLAKRPDDVLVDRPPGDSVRMYEPLTEPDLFASFARVEPTKPAILHFANQYGWLGIGSTTVLGFVKSGVKGVKADQRLETQPILRGEPFYVWAREIVRMRHAIEIWECLDGARPEVTMLRDRIEWTDKGVRYSLPHGSWIAHSEDPKRAHLLERWRRGELVGPAKLFVVDTINRGLHGNVSSRLLYTASGRFQPYSVPHHLLGALWYQFYRAFIGERKIRRCAVCGLWMTYERSTKRMHPACSNQERQQRFRRKHAKETRGQ